MFFRRSALAAVVLVIAAAVIVSAAAAAPRPPTNLRITGTTDTSISLAWDASRGNSGNWWYCVQRGSSGCIRVNPPQTSITITGLMPNTTFVYSVYAITAQGHRSANSNTVTYTTPPDTTPPAPAPTLSLTYLRPTRIGVSWTASVDNTSQVWYSLYVNGSVYFQDAIGAQSRTLFYLTPSTTYEFKVTARDRYFNTVESNVLSVTTPAATDTVPPTAPTNLRETGFFDGEVHLDWDPSTDDTDPQSEILYDIYLNGELTPDGGFGDSGITYCRESGPTTIVVKAVDTSGNVSAPSNEILVNC
jgi:chitodextrinase